MAEHSYDTPTKSRPRPGLANEHAFPNIQSGRYKFISVIGYGGAGSVYRALDVILDKEVAIKKLHRASDDQAIRFQREAKLAGALKHENVMSALDFGVTDENEPYLILDYVRGESLSSFIRRSKRIPLEDALHIAIQIANGLNHAHKNGVIHRDIKPSNVILVDPKLPSSAGILSRIVETGTAGQSSGAYKKALVHDPSSRTAKIVDFGLAKSINESQNLTQVGTGLGTPRYMSPEHARGIEVDERSDIYSLGCLIFEALTGDVPFSGETVLETLDMHINLPPPSMASRGIVCSENLEQIVATCLNKRAKDRFHNAGDLADKLKKELLDIEKIRTADANELHNDSQTEQVIAQPEAIVRNNRALMLVAALTAAILMVLLAMQFLSNDEQNVKNSTAKKTSKRTYSNPIFDVADANYRSESKIFRDTLNGRNANAWGTNNAQDIDVKEFLRTNNGRRIEAIDLSGSDLTETGYKMLADRTKLKNLEYSFHPMTKAALRNIALIPTVRDLRLGGAIDYFEPGAISELTKLKNLQVLYIGEMKLNEQAFEELSQIETLTVLQLTACTGLQPEGLKHLSKLTELNQLKLDSSDVDDTSGSVLSVHPRLEKLILRNTNVTKNILAPLEKIKTLNQLDLSNTRGITNSDVQKLKRIAQQRGLTLSVELSKQPTLPPSHGLDKYTPEITDRH